MKRTPNEIDALFDHMIRNLNHQMDEEYDWFFYLRSNDLARLHEIADELAGEFDVHVQEIVEHTDVDGTRSLVDPMLKVLRCAALSAAEVKAIAERMQGLADERGVIYEGVSCYDAIDLEQIFGWLSPEDACWRLRHMTDCGLEDGSVMPWAFLLRAPDAVVLGAIESALVSSGFDEYDAYDLPSEDGLLTVNVFVSGRNSEHELMLVVAQLSELADHNGGQLQGIQFYTREEVYKVFFDDDETESASSE